MHANHVPINPPNFHYNDINKGPTTGPYLGHDPLTHALLENSGPTRPTELKGLLQTTAIILNEYLRKNTEKFKRKVTDPTPFEITTT
jgi:hypothetical protein